MFLNITRGVPQGSVLGPKLFTTYINDICRVTNILRFVVFADDTTILFSGEGFKDLKLSLNSSKTKFVVWKSRNVYNWRLEIDKVSNERVFEKRFLGVTLDYKLCWKV